MTLRQWLCIDLCLAFPTSALILIESFGCVFRQLLPKPPASHHAVHLVMPPPLSPLKTQEFGRSGATNDVQLAAHSAAPFDPAEGTECVRQMSAAAGSCGLQSQDYHDGGMETPASTIPKISHRVRKPRDPQAKSPRTAVACRNCRSVIIIHHLTGLQDVDIKREFRLRRLKCSGEVPSCSTCLRKGKQCEGYIRPMKKGSHVWRLQL